MKDDERQCPNCGRDVLGWDVPCPGCAQVPWDTPAGGRTIAARRRGHFLRTQGPLLVLVLLGAVLVLMGPVHFARLLSSHEKMGSLGKAVNEGMHLHAQWAMVDPEAPQAERLQRRSRQWLEEGLPQLLEAIQDPTLELSERATIVIILGKLFQSATSFGSVSPQAREDLIETLRQIAEREQDSVRAEAALVLRVLGASPERVVDGALRGAYNQ